LGLGVVAIPCCPTRRPSAFSGPFRLCAKISNKSISLPGNCKEWLDKECKEKVAQADDGEEGEEAEVEAAPPAGGAPGADADAVIEAPAPEGADAAGAGVDAAPAAA